MDCPVCIPRPVLLVIDDVGWREGWSVSDQGGPCRAGVDRLLDECDYAAVADLGEALNCRPQCAMVLCEWDREDVCAAYPTTTHAGAAWTNADRVGDWALDARDLFVERAAHIEFAMHGVGHQHWDNGVRTGAEWYGKKPEQRWPWEVLQGHLDCFRRILEQYGLGEDNGVSFPPSFVPCAFCYYWDDSDPESTGALMRGAGVRYASTPFSSCTFAAGPPDRPDGGFDRGLLVLDRGHSGVRWDVTAAVPEGLPTTAICGVHWPNLLADDPKDNGQAVALWADYLGQMNRTDGLFLAANTAETFSQWVYSSYATLREHEGRYLLDASTAPPGAAPYAECPIVKVKLPLDQHVSKIVSHDCRPAAYWERDGFGFVSLQLDQGPRAAFEIQFGPDALRQAVQRDGTFDVLGLDVDEREVRAKVRVYGQQTLSVAVPFAPGSAETDCVDLTVAGMDYDPGSGVARVQLSGWDIHGEVGTLRITG